MKLGDAAHKVLRPIAEHVIDPLLGTNLKNCVKCNEDRRTWLNDLGDSIYDELFEPKKKKPKTEETK